MSKLKSTRFSRFLSKQISNRTAASTSTARNVHVSNGSAASTSTAGNVNDSNGSAPSTSTAGNVNDSNGSAPSTSTAGNSNDSNGSAASLSAAGNVNVSNVLAPASSSTAANSSFKPPRKVVKVQKASNQELSGSPSKQYNDTTDVESTISYSGSEKFILNDQWLAEQDTKKPAMSSGEKCSAYVSRQSFGEVSGIVTLTKSPSASNVTLVAYTPSPSVTSSTSEVTRVRPTKGAKRSINFDNLVKHMDNESMICDNDDTVKNNKQKETSLVSYVPSKKKKQQGGSAYEVKTAEQDTSKNNEGNGSKQSVECISDDDDKENYKQKGPRNENIIDEGSQRSTEKRKQHQKAEVPKGNQNVHSDSSPNLSPYQLARLKNIERNKTTLNELLAAKPGLVGENNDRDSTKKSIKSQGIGSAAKPGTSSKISSAKTNRSRSLRPPSSSKPQYNRFYGEEDEDETGSEVDSPSETIDFSENDSGDHSDGFLNNDSDDDSSKSDSSSDKTQGSRCSHNVGDNDIEEMGCGLSTDDELQPEATPPATQKCTQNNRKLLRNSGQEYTQVNGKVKKARAPIQAIHECVRLKCSENITVDDAKIIFSEYWKQASYEKRKLYVASRIEERPKQRSRPRIPGSGRSKNKSCNYYLFVQKKKVQVCRETFIDVLCETDAFVRGIVAKKTTTGTVHNDKRGKHKTKRKMSPQRMQQVLDHISLFPKYESHYCRKQTSQRYLQSHLSVKIMHRDYKGKVSKPVSYWSYRRLFKTLKLKFKKPNKDTCAKCDAFNMKIKVTSDNNEKEKLEKEMELHKRKADAGYQLKRASREGFAADPSKRVLVFDLEQCLPTPLLRSSEVYYLRQLYVFNLTIYDCSTKLTHCYMWHEGEGGRGANEIASCIYRHCMSNVNIPEEVKHIRLFSDSCTGQNKNSIVSSMFLTLLQEKESLDKIDHIFLVPGHTRLECDNKHSVIERASRNCESLQVPSEWYSLVDISGKTNIDKYPDGRFKVVQMKKKFYDFAALISNTGPLVRRDNDEEGQRFYYRETSWFQYCRNNQFKVNVKSSFNEEAHFKKVNFLRRKRDLKSGLQLTSVLHRLPAVVPIAEKKKNDLLKLLKFISSEHHAFYKGLATSNDISGDKDPDLPSDNSDESDDSSDE